MARAEINLISLSGDNFVDVGLQSINALLAVNTDNEDITLDLIIGPKTIDGTTTTTDAFFILKAIPIPVGSTFDFAGDAVLGGAGKIETIIKEYKSNKKKFETVENLTFLIRLGSSHTADVVLRR